MCESCDASTTTVFSLNFHYSKLIHEVYCYKVTDLELGYFIVQVSQTHHEPLHTYIENRTWNYCKGPKGHCFSFTLSSTLVINFSVIDGMISAMTNEDCDTSDSSILVWSMAWRARWPMKTITTWAIQGKPQTTTWRKLYAMDLCHPPSR